MARRGPAQSGGRAVSVAPASLTKTLAPPAADFLASNQGTTVANSIWSSLALFAAQEQGPGGLFGMLWPLLAIGLLFWFLLIRPQQQEKKQREGMLSVLKKSDRVITAGGIYGVVTNVHREADEVTIKVDEAANVKLRVTVGSIARVLIDESSDDSSSK